MNLADLLGAAATRDPTRPAITDLASGRSLDYATLAGRVDDAARQLRAAGVERGQRVALAAENALGHVPAAFGILAAGACLVPLAPTLRPAEVAAVLEETDVNARVTLRDDAPVLEWIDRKREPPPGFAATDAAFIRFTGGVGGCPACCASA